MHDVRPRLLDHPFYQAWTRGEVHLETLAEYHQGYREFICRMPLYWKNVVHAFGVATPLAAEIIREETEHVHLWDLWGCTLPLPRRRTSLQELIAGFDAFSPSELLGGLQAFEMQQPEVARTKKAGLLSQYGFGEAELRYFDEHLAEEKHIAFGSRVAAAHASSSEYHEGLRRGAELVYHSLDRFATMDA